MKILLIHLSSRTGIVLSSLLARCIKQQLADTTLHYLTDDGFRSMIEYNPHIEKVFVKAHSHELMIEELKPENYDCIIDLDNNPVSHKVYPLFPKAKIYSLKKNSLSASLYNTFRVDIFPQKHLADQYLQVAAHLKIHNDQQGLDYFISAREETKKQDIPASHHAGFIAVFIGQDHPRGTKGEWPLEKWKSFCSKMDHPMILLGEKPDAEKAEVIRAIDTIKIYSACGKFNHNEMADLAGKAKLLLTPSSWVMQAAAAYKRPVVWLHDGVLPARMISPYYGDQYLSSRSRSPFIQCSTRDEVDIVIKSIHTYL
jgi:ADP-heptose:LPS heptosyltransferase